MPGTTEGVYPGALDAGTEVSSTYEGRHLTVRDDELIHPLHDDVFVNKGDPVIVCDAGAPATYGRVVGVAFVSGTAAADWISIDTEGIFNLPIYADDDVGGSDIEIGDPLYIRVGHLTGLATLDGLGDAEIRKRRNLATQVFFGYALGSLTAAGAGVIAIKVHAAPEEQQDEYISFLTAHGADLGKAFYCVDASENVGGTSAALHTRYTCSADKTAGAYGISHWIKLIVNADLPNAHGIYMSSSAIDNHIVNILSQIMIYEENIGTGIASHFNIMIGRNSNAVLTAPGNNAYMYFREHATVQEESCVFMLQGNNAAEYLFAFGSNPDTGKLLLENSTAGSDTNFRIRCNTTVGVRWLHLHGS